VYPKPELNLFIIISSVNHTISKKLGYRLSPQPSSLKLRFERGALVDRSVAPVDRNGIRYDDPYDAVTELLTILRQ
jgi:hypothetical protein